jgi:hypothetical protein
MLMLPAELSGPKFVPVRMTIVPPDVGMVDTDCENATDVIAGAM